MPRAFLRLAAAVLAVVPAAAMAADFRVLAGHGGPVQDAAVSPDGRLALTASFDNSVGLWDLGADEVRWLEGHAAAVKCAIFLPGGEAASSGDDFEIRVWSLASGATRAVLSGHQGQIKSLAVSPDGARLASASWDGTIGLWDLGAGRNLAMLAGHAGAVNDVAFLEDGATLASASADGTIRLWDAATGEERRTLTRHGFGVTTLLAGPGWLAYGAVDGGTRVIDPVTGSEIADLTLDRRPILALAASPDGKEIAVGDGEGYVMTVATATWRITGDYKAAANGPVWALAYTSDGQSLVAGGIDDAAYVIPAHGRLDAPVMATVKRGFLGDPGTMSNGERQFRRKCSICHSLAEDGIRRAGPTLKGLFGRPAGSVPGYAYSDTVANLGLDWTEENVDRLFDLGPDHFIPGSKMPMQRITRPEDRQDLIDFLKNNT